LTGLEKQLKRNILFEKIVDAGKAGNDYHFYLSFL